MGDDDVMQVGRTGGGLVSRAVASHVSSNDEPKCAQALCEMT